MARLLEDRREMVNCKFQMSKESPNTPNVIKFDITPSLIQTNSKTKILLRDYVFTSRVIEYDKNTLGNNSVYALYGRMYVLRQAFVFVRTRRLRSGRDLIKVSVLL